MKNLKLFINRLLKTILLSSIIFYTIKINIVQYFLIMLAVWFLLFWNYNMNKNIEIFDIFIITSLGNFISYTYVKEIFYNGLTNEKFTYIGSSIFLLALLIISIFSFYLSLRSKKNLDNKKLMVKREKDLDRLLYYLDKFNIIGINAIWGAGKSFLINELKKCIEEKYEIIEIDILSCNLNELQLILIKEIEKVMYKNRIISKYSNKLKKFLADEKIFCKFWNLIFDENYSYSETIKGFQDELSRMNKKVIIIYEDIDRISDEKVIKSIFGLSEKLSNNNIKILYQYHEDKLKEIGFDSDYLEKYVPYKINLTEITFFETLNFVLKENKLDINNLEISDFNFLQNYGQKYRYNVLQEEFQIDKQIYFNIPTCSIRKVENYLTELNTILHNEQYMKYKETVITFFFIKHFIPSIYQKLNIEMGLLETLKFSINSKLYTMVELINIYKLGDLCNHEIDDSMFNCEENKMHYCILGLFDYNNNTIVYEDNCERRLQAICEEPIKTLEDRISNEKKDRLIWSLLANGKSKYTDYEYVGSKFIKDVLEKPRNEQVNAYNQFYQSLFHQDNKEVDNETIFKIGIPTFIELFKSFRVLNVDDKEKIALIDLYFEMDEIKNMNNKLIQTINYCSFETKKEYIYILNRINKLGIVVNLNFEKSFNDFLKKCLEALLRFSYINISGYSNIVGNELVNENKKSIVRYLERTSQSINDLKNKISNKFQIKELEDELETIIIFLKKMIELINCEKQNSSKRGDLFKSTWTSCFENQGEFERLKELISKNGDFNEEMRKSYLEGKITAYEIDKLIDSDNVNVEQL